MNDGQSRSAEQRDSFMAEEGAEDLYVTVGCPLGRLGHQATEVQGLREDGFGWFRHGDRYLQVEQPYDRLLMALQVPRDLEQFVGVSETMGVEHSALLLEDLLSDELVVRLPAEVDDVGWECVHKLRVISQGLGLGQSQSDPTRFIVVPNWIACIPVPDGRSLEEVGEYGVVLSALDYHLWMTLDGVRSLNDCMSVTCESTGARRSRVAARVPGLLKILLRQGLGRLDVSSEGSVSP